MGGNLLAILSGLSAVAAIMALLVVRVDERSALARILAWIQRPLKEQEALKRRISELEERVEHMSAVIKVESDARVAQYDEVAQRIADLKLRADADGKRLTDTQGNVFNNGLELDALGSKQKQAEAQLEEYRKALTDARITITGLQRDDLKIYKANGEIYRMVNDRLRRLEGLPPSGYVGQVSLPDLPDPDDTAEPF